MAIMVIYILQWPLVNMVELFIFGIASGSGIVLGCFLVDLVTPVSIFETEGAQI